MSMEDPDTRADTRVPSYWLNWRFLLSALIILSGLILAIYFLKKYEGSKKSKKEGTENQLKSVGTVYEDDAWMTSFKTVHPGWLLGYRIVAFIFLFSMIVADLVENGYTMAFYYTEWTFVCVTVYFLIGCTLSISGCKKYNQLKRDSDNAADHVRDEEQGTNVGDNADDEQCPSRQTAGVYVYIFQVLFQICGGAVLLTDIIFWSVLYPNLDPEYEELDFIFAGMHTLNAVCMIIEIALHNLRFPFFRIAYFVLWTVFFVTVQWIVRVFIDVWWPYEFLDLASNFAPLWYLGVGLAHVPCYGICFLFIKAKHWCFSRSFPETCRGKQ